MDMSKCYCGIALTCPRHGPFEEPQAKTFWFEDGYWWARNDLEDDSYGPFDTPEEARAIYEEMN